MFSGIIEAVGTLSAFIPRGQDARARIATGALDLSDVKLGDSIAVNGVCLTVAAIADGSFEADLSAETLARTTFKNRKTGDKLNLEKALMVGQRFGGHLVSGHVDDVGRLRARQPIGESVRLIFTVARPLGRFVAEKGSICVDGVSLTVNAVADTEFSVNIVPHTLAATTLGSIAEGGEVNLEVDLIARYLDRLLKNPV